MTGAADWLAPVGAALAADEAPLTLFCRDDDVGWDDHRLWPLIDVLAQAGGSLDMAVIPRALQPATAERLGRLVAQPEAGLHLHQHGYAHCNHQTSGRKCEFGDARSAADKAADIANGRSRLQALLGEHLEPVFTPPWNRCDQATVDALIEQGFSVLSRDAGARPVEAGPLREVPVSFDWCKYSDGSSSGWQRIGTTLAGQVRDGGPLGLMFHHAVMTADDHRQLAALLQCLQASGRIRWHHILSLAQHH